jgi:hypothetical protein
MWVCKLMTLVNDTIVSKTVISTTFIGGNWYRPSGNTGSEYVSRFFHPWLRYPCFNHFTLINNAWPPTVTYGRRNACTCPCPSPMSYLRFHNSPGPPWIFHAFFPPLLSLSLPLLRGKRAVSMLNYWGRARVARLVSIHVLSVLDLKQVATRQGEALLHFE